MKTLAILKSLVVLVHLFTLSVVTVFTIVGLIIYSPDESFSVVYGDDDRTDVYDYQDDPHWVDVAMNSVVALIRPTDIDMSDPDNVQLTAPTLQDYANLCSGERFLNQPTAAFCSGLLIDDDLVLTAGQCVQDQADCASTSLVFNYQMVDADTLQTITSDDVFSCQEIVVREYSSAIDYAILRLDRSATPRFTPADVVGSYASAVPNGTPLVVIGSPSGLPSKIDDGGSVRDNRQSHLDYFVANLDTFGGNSGSGVYNQDTNEVVGILVRGDTDYVSNGNCNVVNVCSENGCSGEDSTYAFHAVEALCNSIPSSRVCGCGDGTCDPGETSVNCWQDCGTVCGDGACNGSETLASCPGDCAVCGDGICSTPYEDLTTCVFDCSVCGDGICTGEETYLNCSVECICGDGTCDNAESRDGSCCNDCGCPVGLGCTGNVCTLTNGDGTSCQGPIVVSPSGTQVFLGDTTASTNDTSPSCATSSAPDRVYAFTLDTTLWLNAQVTGFDTVLYLRQGCDDPDSELACNDDNDPPGANGSHISQGLPPGTYFLFVDGHADNAGAYTLTIEFTTETPCDSATLISPSGTQVFLGDTTTSTNDTFPSCSTSNAQDDMYVFTLDMPYHVMAQVSGFDTVLYIQAACLNPASEIACNDDDPSGGSGSSLDLTLNAGTYFLIVDGYSSDVGPYTLEVTFESSGCITNPECDDGLFCTGIENCLDGQCESGDYPCGQQLCDEVNDTCIGCDADDDCDGIPDASDNCPSTPNTNQANSDGDSYGDACDNCPTTPNTNQLDTYPPQGNGIGDACDCECDFNCDTNVDATDVTDFLTDFGRSTFFNPCTNASPCNGDVDCNVNVDANDVTNFLQDFGRSQFNNPCPACEVGDWCVYP